MFGVINAALRAFVVGVVVGMLFAPRPGVETRRMLNERIASMVNQLLEIAALPPIEPTQVATNGHPERPATKRTRSTEGPGARTTS
ncbi:MAG TPA: YtxH domain-containing protein [Candidatus Limnocylindria bacterium]|nr:YtxH domain-containing protein [Candidatus Limnocylindria bacterium]